MTVKFSPSVLSGSVDVPPSKSYAHRAIICAALAKGACVINNIGYSEDIKATAGAMKALGAKISGNSVKSLCVKGITDTPDKAVGINCAESGSTLRFLIPICAALGINTAFSGYGKLPGRPLTPYVDELSKKGITFNYKDNMPVISGKLKSGKFKMRGDISSQFFTGLLFALPLLQGDSEIEVEGVLESRPYLDMTLAILKDFGIIIYENKNNSWGIPGGQEYKSRDYTVENDFSQAAFWAVAGAVNSGIILRGFPETTAQGDRRIFDILQSCGAEVSYDKAISSYRVNPPISGKLKPFTQNAADIPDLVPVLSVLAAFCDGTSRIENAARLKIKESDRLTAICSVINALGGQANCGDDWLGVTGETPLPGGQCDSCNDHRIAMSAAILASKCTGSVTLTRAAAINKSYPGFYEDYRKLGGITDVLCV